MSTCCWANRISSSAHTLSCLMNESPEPSNCREAHDHDQPKTKRRPGGEVSETNSLIVYGASDDLIEVAGILNGELNPPYGKPALITVTTDDVVYTRIHIEYDPDGSGEWRIQPTAAGCLVTVVPARGEDEGDDEHGCPGYSDKAVIDMNGIEARRIAVTCKEAGR